MQDILYAIAIILIFQLSRKLFRKLVGIFVRKFSKDSRLTFINSLLQALATPIEFLFTVIGISIAFRILTIPDEFYSLGETAIRTLFLVVIFWIINNSIEPFREIIEKFVSKFGNEFSKDITNFIVKTAKFLILSIAVVAILQEWGYNISGFLASLGLVGMAFALAAKDSASNLFGSLVIFTDKPFKIGDWVVIDDVEGTIETIGIRSTKVRTFAKALVTVPNSKVVNSSILNWTRMNKRRIKMKLGLTYDTTESQLKKITYEIKNMLINHPDIDQDTIYIYFTDFDDSSLGIFSYFFTKTTNWEKYMMVKEDVNFKIMQIINDNGASFAFPSQTLYLEKNREDLDG
jgi:MscS family membrane protein